MNEELADLIEDVEKVEKKEHEQEEKILEKLASVKTEDKRVLFSSFFQ